VTRLFTSCPASSTSRNFRGHRFFASTTYEAPLIVPKPAALRPAPFNRRPCLLIRLRTRRRRVGRSSGKYKPKSVLPVRGGVQLRQT